MKKYLLLPLFIFAFLVGAQKAFAQPSVCVIDDYILADGIGEEVCIQFVVNDFTDLTSMSFDVYFNNFFQENIDDKIELTSVNVPGSTTALIPTLTNDDIDITNAGTGTFRFDWSNTNPNIGDDLPDGTVLFEACFNTVDNLGGTPIEIVGDRVTRDISGNFNIGFEFIKEGRIQIGLNSLFVNIPSVSGLQGDLVCMNFTVDNFVDMLAVQFSVHFDETALELVSTDGVEPTTGGGFNFGTPEPGVVTMTWSDADGANGVSVPDGSSFIQLCFNLIGDCTSLNPVTIESFPTTDEAVCVQSVEIGTSDVDKDVFATDGSVTIDCEQPGAPSLCIPDISDICPGESFSIDVTAQDFDNIRRMDWSLNWNPSVLQLDNITETTALTSFNINANVGGGFATCNWQSGFFGASLADGATVFTLDFTVVGGGGSSSTISITGSPQEIFFTDQNGPNADHIGYNSCNGFFQACSPTGITVSAGNATADPGAPVCVDVTVQDFSNITDLAFSMDWETSVLDFVEVTNFNLPGLTAANFNLSAVNFGVLCLEGWNSTDGASLPDGATLFTLCFEAENNPLACGAVNFSGSPCEEVVMQEGLDFDIGMNSNSGEVCLTNPAQFVTNISNEGGATGSFVCVDVSVQNFQNLSDMEYSVNWNPALLDFLNIDNPTILENLNDSSFDVSDVDNGNLTINWEAPPNSGETLPDGTVIYSICFQVLMEQSGCALVDISGNPTAINIQNANSNNNIGMDFTGGEICLVDEISVTAVISGVSCNSPDADCDGSIDVTAAGGGGNYTYEWSGPGINAGNETNEDQMGLCPGIYQLRVRDTGTGLLVDEIFEVGAAAGGPVANAGGDTNLNCGSPLLNLDVSGNGTSEGGNYTYLWEGEGNVNVNPTTAESLMPAIAGCGNNLYFSVTDQNTGCTVSDTIFIACAVTPSASAGEDQPFDCTTETLELMGSGSTGEDFTITWTAENGGTVMQDADDPFLATASTPGDYILTIFNPQNNCEATDTMTIANIRTEPVAEAGDGATIDCDNESVTLDGTGSETGTDIVYEWQGPNFGVIATTLIASTTETGTHYIFVTDTINGCVSVDSVEIQMDNDLPEGDAGENQPFFCNTTDVTLSGTGPTDGGNYTFNWTGPGTITNGETLMPTVTTFGTYTLTITNTDTGCDANYTVVVEDMTMPPVASAVSDSVLTCAMNEVEIDGSGTDQGLEYAWLNNDGTLTGIVSGETSLNPIVNAPGIYNLTVTDPVSGCTNTVSTEVFGDPALPQAVITDNGVAITCTNETLTLDASQSTTGADFEYTWTGPCLDDVTNPQAPVVSCAGTYQLIVTDTVLNCVSEPVEIVITEDTAEPVIDTEANITIDCGQTEVTLDASASSSGDDFTITWEALDGMILSGETGLTPTVTAGTFGLSIVNTVNGCEATQAVFVEENAVVADAGEDAQIECGSELTLDGTNSTPGLNYSWTNSLGTTDGITDPNTLTPTISIAGTYTLTVSDESGNCTDTDEVTLTSNSVVADAGPDVPFTCEDEFVTLDGSGSDTNEGTTYEWTSAEGSFVSSVTSITVDVNAVGVYVLTVTDAEGCQATSEVTVFQDAGNLPEAEILSVEHDLCETTANLEAVLPDGTTGLWTSTANSVVFTPDTTATTIANDIPGGEVLLIWTLSTENCPNYDADSVLVISEFTPVANNDEFAVIMGEPELSIDLLENDNTQNVPSFTFSLNSDPSIGDIIDNPGDGTLIYAAPQGIAGGALFDYTLCNTNCPMLCDSATVTIALDGEIDPNNLPNAITPNNDGLNDVLVFDILNAGEFPNNSLTIFNRWGDEVLNVSPYNNDWDGTFNGKALPQATYYYVLRLDLSEGQVIQGDITILK